MMFRLPPVSTIHRVWNKQDSVSKFVIGISFLLVIFAYLPTLQTEYVPQDQWRAFRYSITPETPTQRAAACSKMLVKFYPLTGRPLVWPTECLEHAAVAKISDFAYLRPIALLLVLVTVGYMGYVLAPYTGGFALGIVTASAFVFAPGYSFMYLQSLTAGMVLVSIILSVASFDLLKRRLCKFDVFDRRNMKSLVWPLLLWLSSCYIYPAWAFIVIPLGWLMFLFDNENNGWLKQLRIFIGYLTCYFIGAVVYYLSVKLFTFLYSKISGPVPDLGVYAVAMQLNVKVVWARLTELASYFYTMPPLNFKTPHGVPLALLVALSAIIGWGSGRRERSTTILSGMLRSIAIFGSGAVILFASVSPWLFSHMDVIFTRHLIAWNLLYCVAAMRIILAILSRLPQAHRKWIPLVALLGVSLPVAATQNKLSFLETANSSIEIQTLRNRVNTWLDEDGWVKHRYLLVVLPTAHRSKFIENMVGNTYTGENVSLSSDGNPVSIPWMIIAILREQKSISIGKEIKLVDCGLDQSCAVSALRSNKNNVVLNITRGGALYKTFIPPFIINLSLITAKTVSPVFTRGALPEVTASSQYDNFGPYNLLLDKNPPWHAERPPKYPQTLSIDLGKVKAFRSIGFLPQDGAKDRAPNRIRIFASKDGKSWVHLTGTQSICKANAPDGWHEVRLDKKIKARFLVINIKSNCGNPDLLTLKGLRIE